MERFIEDSFQEIRLTMFYLKSSMERFIAGKNAGNATAKGNLKSSMERFIASQLHHY